jgi:hypothetical protein
MQKMKMTMTTNLRTNAKRFWPLIKSLQTGLLLLTGLAGFMSSRCPVTNWQIGAGVDGQPVSGNQRQHYPEHVV